MEEVSRGQYIITTGYEANVLYKLDKSLAVFVGDHWGKFHSLHADGFSYSPATKSTIQFGLVASTPIGQNTSLYGIADVGSAIQNFELGLSYSLSNNLEFNAEYRDSTSKDMTFENDVLQTHVKDLGYGLTFKF